MKLESEKENEKETKTVLANINCVLSTKTVEDVLFVTDSECIIKFPNSLMSNNLLDYIGDDFLKDIGYCYHIYRDLIRWLADINKLFI